MFRNQQKQFFDPNRNIFRIPRPKQKKIFLDSSTPAKKKIFSDSPTQTRDLHDQIVAAILSRSIVSSGWSIVFVEPGWLFCQQKVGHGNETKCFGIRNNSFIETKKKIFLDSSTQKKKIFLDSSTQTKKNIFRFLDPNKKKIFSDSSNPNTAFSWPNPCCCFSTGQLFVMVHCFVGWSIVSSAKVGHGNETKCFGISRNKSFIQTKQMFFRFLDSDKKKLFSDSSTQTKKKYFFRFLDPNKKSIFRFRKPKKAIYMTKSLLLFSAGRFVSSAESWSWKWNKMFQNQKQFFHPNK